MLTKKEISAVSIAVILMALILSFNHYYFQIDKFPIYLLFSAAIILISVFSKKITARIINVKAEIKLWEWKRYGIYTRSEFKKPIPVGALLSPLLFILFSFRFFFCFLQFEAEALTSKVIKKFGARRFSGIMEWDDALLVFYSVIPLIVLALLINWINFAVIKELANLSIYYLAWNLIPLSKLDGTRLLFGSRPLFVFTWIILILTGLIVLL